MRYKYSLVAAVLLLAGLGFTGCGGNSADKKKSMALHMTPDKQGPVAHIGNYSRGIDKVDFDPDQIEWEYDNLEGLKIHVDEKMLYLYFTHNISTENIQFIIDADNNPSTGNLEENGADYIVENGYIYQSSDPDSWSWKELGAVQSVVKNGKSDAVAIDLSYLKNKSVVFKVSAQALDENWVPKVMSPQDGMMSVYSQKTSIEWDKITSYAVSGSKSLKIFSSKENIYLHLEEKQFSDHIQLYIDSDNNKATGYRNSDTWGNLGADYLVEDGYLYRYTGEGDWGWAFIDTVSKYRSEGENAILDVTVPKQKLQNLSSALKVGAELNDKTWTDTQLVGDDPLPVYYLQIPSSDAKVIISEVMAANTHTLLDPDYYNFSDWIELYNADSKAVDISGYKLSDKLNSPKWTFPGGTVIPAHGYLLVWADEKDKKKKALHSNFKLKMDGEAVALFDPNGKLLEGFEYLKQVADISTVLADGKEHYMQPTPGSQNSTGYDKVVLATKPVLSVEEGFYADAQNVSISVPSGSTVYYTLDGSLPTTDSAKYTGTITVDHTAILRAMRVENGKFQSPVVTKSYIIGEDINLPVISLSIDEKYLFDDQVGIYTIGTNGKKLEDCGDDAPDEANYMQKWERPAHLTFFEADKKVVLSQDIGLKVAGECSKIYAQKSFQLKADDKYGKSKFTYKVFPDKPIKKYRKLKLRNAGQDYLKTHMRDALVHMIAKGEMQVSYEAFRPAVVFVNGAYWGLYNLREKKGKDYLKENFGVKKVDLLEDDLVVKEGSSEDYEALLEYLQTHSLASAENYNYVASKIDIDNYIDYMITNIYIGNADWPGTNLLYWKAQKEGAKWQWLLHDTDYSFALHSENGVDYNALADAMTNNGEEWPNPEWSTFLFRKLLENPGFKSTFKNRFLTKIDTTFKPSRVNGIIDSVSSQIAPYIQRHIDRWKVDGEYSYKVNSKTDWEEEVQKLKDFAEQRPGYVKTHIQQAL